MSKLNEYLESVKINNRNDAYQAIHEAINCIIEKKAGSLNAAATAIAATIFQSLNELLPDDQHGETAMNKFIEYFNSHKANINQPSPDNGKEGFIIPRSAHRK